MTENIKITAILTAISIAMCGLVIAADIYETDFEFFAAGADQLVGTDGWTGTNPGESVHGIDDGMVEGLGKTAFLGFSPPAGDFVSVERLLDYDPLGAGTPTVEFFALIGISDSTNGEFDRFYVSFYNRTDKLLGAIAFDNSASNFGLLRYDGAELIHTGQLFVNDSVQGLFVSINFVNNTWTARLDSVPIFSDQPFNATNASLDLGSIAAEWQILTPGQPGNNWMLFDEWTVTANAAVDDQAPVISNVPANITVSTDPGKSTATVQWAEPTAIDNTGVTSLNSAPANGSPFSVGETIVTYTASDTAGNSTTANFKVTVQDTETPAIVGMPQNVSVTVSPGQVAALVTWQEPTATDNIGVTAFSSNFQSGDAFPEGTTTVTYTARDAAGNEHSANFTVTVTVTNAAESAYLQWWTLHFNEAPVDGGGDADQDGLSNLFEFGIGTHPLIASEFEGVAAAPWIVTESTGATIEFHYEFVTAEALAPGVHLEVIESPTLNDADWSVIASRAESSPWSGPAVTAGTLETTDAGPSKMRTRIAIDTSVFNHRFYRLRVTVPIE